MQPRFTFIDLFAGIGGLRIPFENIPGLPGKCLLTSEKDASARRTYAENFREKDSEGHTENHDVTTLSLGDVPRHDLLLAGFPCQPFSHAAKRLGFEDMRGTLFFHIMAIVEGLAAGGKALQNAPRVVLLENVRGLKGHDGGRTLRRRTEELSRFYVVTTHLLDARDFGLPQSRQRLFIIGIRKDLSEAEKFRSILDDALERHKSLRSQIQVGDILEADVPERYMISDLLWASHQARKKKHEERGNGFGYRLVTGNSTHTATLSARYYKDGSEILVSDPRFGNPRKLTPREAANLQGFPRDFKIPVSDTQAYKQFGNAVPVRVIEFLAAVVTPYLVGDN